MAEQVLLEVDGAPVGSLRAFHGLDVEAEIATRGFGAHSMPKKHVANVRWTPGVATFGGGMGEGMRGWISEAFDRGVATRSGSAAGADARGSIDWSLAFSGARLSAITFPALDGASKEPALMAVEFTARQVRWGDGGGAPARPPEKPKQWLRSNFRVEIGGLPCNRVMRVGAFTWTCAADGTVTVPDVRLVISRADYAAWEEAARRWFVDGEHRDKHEMTGRITLLSADAKDALATIELGNVGLRSFSREDAGSEGDEPSRFSVVLYVEKIGFTAAPI